jgi:hypothetical protein
MYLQAGGTRQKWLTSIACPSSSRAIPAMQMMWGDYLPVADMRQFGTSKLVISGLAAVL